MKRMRISKKSGGKLKWKPVLIGISVSAITALAFISILAYLTARGGIELSAALISSVGITAIAGMLGCFTTASLVRDRPLLPVSLTAAGVLILAWLGNRLTGNGGLRAPIPAVCAAAAAVLISCAIRPRGKNHKKFR